MLELNPGESFGFAFTYWPRTAMPHTFQAAIYVRAEYAGQVAFEA